MYILKYKDGHMDLMASTIFIQPWVEKEKIVEIIDIGYYETFIRGNLKEIRKLIMDNKLKASSVRNVNQGGTGK